MEQNSQFLGTEPVGRLMRRYAVPCIISLLVGALYNIVDQIFIANASYLGSYGNAANTVVFPLTVVALAIAVMIGDGCCAFVSISLGQGDQAAAKRSVGNAVVMSVAGSLVLTAVYLLMQNQIIALFGGTVNEETFQYSQEYFFYISLGIPFLYRYEMGLCKKRSDFAGQRPAGDRCLCRGAENAVLRTSGSGGSAGRQPERLPPSFWVQTKKSRRPAEEAGGGDGEGRGLSPRTGTDSGPLQGCISAPPGRTEPSGRILPWG